MHISLAAEKLFSIFGFPITNTLLMAWLAMAVLLGFALVVKRSLAPVPHSGAQNFAEMAIDGAVSFVESVVGSRKDAERFFPIVGTIFFFILVSNWMGILPGVGTIGFFEEVGHGEAAFVPLFRSAYSDVNMTLALAVSSVVIVHVMGIATIGIFKHAGKFLNFSNPILFFVGILELVGEVAKMISFSFRLFGNIFAGEVLLVVISFLVPYVAPLPFMGLELFVGFMQALVFSILTLVFLKIATEEHH